MNTNIERLFYFERQYLQSSDFKAEQTYHLEMRRRLNLALHLWGIVEGLELLNGVATEGASNPFYVSEGMAIDAYGREIIVNGKHLLSEDLGPNGITGAGTYSVWIGYTLERTTPPQAGFQRCNGPNPFTRLRESFEIIISSLTANPNPAEEPDRFGDLPDDPTKYPWLIHLGTISVDQSQTITAATTANRIYIGLRTQSIYAPRHAIPEYNFLNANTALDPLTSIVVKDNFFFEQNLIAGKDFAVDPQKIQLPPIAAPPGTFPNPTGNAKIAGDLFLQGSLYTHCDLTHPELWLSLDQCIRERVKNLVPEIHIDTRSITFSKDDIVDPTGAVIKAVDVELTTQLTQVDPVLTTIKTSIAGIRYQVINPHKAERIHVGGLQAPVASPSDTTDTEFRFDTSGQLFLQSGSEYKATLTCTIAPGESLATLAVTVLVTYIVIFYPKT